MSVKCSGLFKNSGLQVASRVDLYRKCLSPGNLFTAYSLWSWKLVLDVHSCDLWKSAIRYILEGIEFQVPTYRQVLTGPHVPWQPKCGAAVGATNWKLFFALCKEKGQWNLVSHRCLSGTLAENRKLDPYSSGKVDLDRLHSKFYKQWR